MQRRAVWTRRRTAAVIAAAGLMVASAPAGGAAEPGGGAAEPGADVEPKTYVVQMALDPVATYDGGVGGLEATRAEPGEDVDPEAPEVVEYAGHLQEQQLDALDEVGAEPLYHFVFAFDGFAAELTQDQAAELAARPDVVAVTEDTKREIDTSSTPSFLGLDDDGGLWEQLGGPVGSLREPGAGEDVVIGIIDTGIWPDAKSFTDRDERGRRTYVSRPFGFRGACVPAADGSWAANDCNAKLLSARHYNAGWGGDEGVAEQLPWEFVSPRDYNGHGTHTASTAGGNHGVATTGAAAAFGPISGIAPRARIAAYKALWSTEDGSTAGGYDSDLVAAVDQAVADGVDVINYSVSGTSTDFLDPVEVAFLNAADAGVFVAASAGNDGPTGGTVAHPSPWVTTVAAGTHDRATSGAATLGDGTRLTGASVAATQAGPAPLVDAAAAGLAGADPTAVAQCWSAGDNGGAAVLDPAVVTGKIVVCDRGVTPRVSKSKAVAEAGGIGMILVNTGAESLNTDFHSVPTVHVEDTVRDALKAYAATKGATATVHAAAFGETPAPRVADFSSRGPLTAGAGDLLKPDVVAPGQDILAAVAPPGHNGMDFDLSSGTSMSAPHVAGLAALLADRHPDWSPMMIKSALMTTGFDVLDSDGADPATMFAQGAGHVAPTRAADPGLVYDSDADDWLAFLCGATRGVEEETCASLESAGFSLEPSDFNGASIAIGRVSNSETVTRTVTNVGSSDATYRASVEGLDGIDVTVTPSSLTLAPGESASFTVTFDVVSPALNAYLGGRLTWTDGTHDVRSPIVLRAGGEDWEARYDGPASAFGAAVDEGQEALLSPSGDRLYVAGNGLPALPGTLRPDYVTAAYDPETGDELWANRFDGPVQGADELGGFGVSPSGDTVYVTGSSSGEGGDSDVVTIAYDGATGEQLWLARYDGPAAAGDSGGGLTVSPSGDTVYVAGTAATSVDDEGTHLDYVTLAYDAATGAQQWATLYDGPAAGTDDARAIAVSPAGDAVVVTGQSRGVGTGLTDWGTVAYDAATGAQRWDVLHNGPDNGIDVAGTLVVAGSTVVVSGSHDGGATSTDWATTGYSLSTGDELWQQTYDGGPGDTDVPRKVVVTPSGDTVVVTGNSWGSGTGSDYATVAYAVASGEQQWAARHDGTASALDIAWDVALTPDGAYAVVTGQSDTAGTGPDYLTIAYSVASGEQVWTGQYDAAGSPDVAAGVAVDTAPDGGRRVFVTGGSSISLGLVTSNVDMATIAYLDPWE